MSNGGYTLASWWQIVEPNQDIKDGKMDLGQYAASLHDVISGKAGVGNLYGDPHKFFAATYVTEPLRQILHEVMTALSGGGGDHVMQLLTPFGGGKTHTLIALYHWARHGHELREYPGLYNVKTIPDVRIGYVSGFEHTATADRPLWQQLLASVVGEAAYNQAVQLANLQTAPGGDFIRALLGNQPTLLLLDEVAHYVSLARPVPMGNTNLAELTLKFMQTLTDVVSKMDNVVVVYSLPKSKGEQNQADTDIIVELEGLTTRVEARREPVSGDDVLYVVQKRLFQLPTSGKAKDKWDSAVKVVGEEYEAAQNRLDHSLSVSSQQSKQDADNLAERIAKSYPFHPALLDLMYQRWGSLPSYQRTRGALRFIALVVRALWEDKTTIPLISPGDVLMSDVQVRNSFLGQVASGNESSSYNSAIDADISGSTSPIRQINHSAENPALRSLNLGTRLATAIMLYSFGASTAEQEGVRRRELFSAVLTPDLDNRNILAPVLEDLTHELIYLHTSSDGRYRFRTQPNINMMIRRASEDVDPTAIATKVKMVFDAILGKSAALPIGSYVWPSSPTDVPDRQARFVIVYLGPDAAGLSEEQQTTRLLSYIQDTNTRGSRQYRNAFALAVPTASRLQTARELARQLLAIEKLLRNIASGLLTQPQQDERTALTNRKDEIENSLKENVANLYDNVYLPIVPASGNAPIAFARANVSVLATQGSSIHERVVSAITSTLGERVVYSTITPAKLATQLGLVEADGTRGRVKFLSGLQVLDIMFGSPDKLKMVNGDALNTAIADGVRGPRFGYAPSARVEGDNIYPDLSQFRYGTEFPLDVKDVQLVTDSYIVGPELAEAFASKRRALEEQVRQAAQAAMTSSISESGVPYAMNDNGTALPPLLTSTTSVASSTDTNSATAPTSAAITVRTTGAGLMALTSGLVNVSQHITAATVSIQLTLPDQDAGDALDRAINQLKQQGIDVQRIG